MISGLPIADGRQWINGLTVLLLVHVVITTIITLWQSFTSMEAMGPTGLINQYIYIYITIFALYDSHHFGGLLGLPPCMDSPSPMILDVSWEWQPVMCFNGTS